jgi:hypothetical protein
MPLELVAATPEIYVNPVPTAVMGSGLAHPSKLVEEKVRQFREDALKQYVENLKVITTDVSYDLDKGNLESRIYDEDVSQSGFMWTVNRKSGDTLLNQIFGTTETLLSKETELPALVVPHEVGFRKPKTLMLVVKDHSDNQLAKVKAFADRLNLNLVFAYHAEDGQVDMESLMKHINDEIGEFAGIVKSFSFDGEKDNLDRIMTIEQPDWLAFLDFDRSFIERFYKINTNQLILSSHLPVVIF